MNKAEKIKVLIDLLERVRAAAGAEEQPTVEVTDKMDRAVHDMIEAQLLATRDFIQAAYGLTHKQAVKLILKDLKRAVATGKAVLGEDDGNA